MNDEQELKALQEIENSMPPQFYLLPDHDNYDKDFKLTDVWDKPRREDIYVRFKNEKQNEYLKKMIPFTTVNNIDYLHLEPTRKFLYNLIPKSII